jgi:hypothetical protein
MGFIAKILKQATHLEELDFSYQSHGNECESEEI